MRSGEGVLDSERGLSPFPHAYQLLFQVKTAFQEKCYRCFPLKKPSHCSVPDAHSHLVRIFMGTF